MPIRPENRKRYPKNWQSIRRKILKRSKNTCERCGAKQGKPHPMTGNPVRLQIMHLNHTPEDCEPSNLQAACQRCHLKHDEKFHRKNAFRYARKDMSSRLQKLTSIEIEV